MELLKPKEVDEIQLEIQKARKVAEALLQDRDESIIHRATSGVEEIWRKSELDYDGLLNNMAKTATIIDFQSRRKQRSKKSSNRSTVEVNIIRSRTEIAVGRFCEIALPTSENPWKLRVTPDPQMSELEWDERGASQPNGPVMKGDVQATIGDCIREIKDEAKKRMSRMETVINDQHVECDFKEELKHFIENAAKAGTGVLKGPSVIKKINRKYVKKGKRHVLKAYESNVPFSKNVDYWNVYLTRDAGSNPKNATGVWESGEISPKNLALLIGVRGYNADAIRSILKQSPKKTEMKYHSLDKKYTIASSYNELGNNYETWEYNGAIPRGDLEALGCNLSYSNEDMAMLSGCVFYVNDIPIKVSLNILDSGELPYDFFQWSKISHFPWGIGIPRQLYYLQKIMNASWRAMMDNSGDAAGVQIIVSDNVVPMDKKYSFGRRKVWRMVTAKTGDNDVRKAFGQFQVHSNIGTYQAIIDMVMKFSDTETGIPSIFGGETQKMPETLGATNIVVDSSNISLRQRVGRFDDVIDSHVTRYYDYNMQYHPDPNIKGDFQVNVIATKAFLERDLQTQSLLQIYKLKNDPDVKRAVDWDKWIVMFDKNRRLDILRHPNEIDKDKQKEKENKTPSDYRVQVAMIRQKTTLDEKKMELDFRKDELRMKYQIEQLRFQSAAMKLSAETGLELKHILKELTMHAADLNQMKEMAKDETKSVQTTEPPFEPKGRARDDMAFQE